VLASENDIPCFRRFSPAFCGSQVNLTVGVYGVGCPLGIVPAAAHALRGDVPPSPWPAVGVVDGLGASLQVWWCRAADAEAGARFSPRAVKLQLWEMRDCHRAHPGSGTIAAGRQAVQMRSKSPTTTKSGRFPRDGVGEGRLVERRLPRLVPPTHPGEMLLEEFLNPLGR
jgi:hypothetical protein